MSVQQGYDLWSANYDADHNPTRDLDGVVTQKVLGALRFDAILEIGCGTGKNTLFLAGIGEKVTAVDFSAGMLAQAKEKVTAPHVSFQVADITAPWPTQDATHDLVTFNLVLEHIKDLNFVFAEVSRSLRPGGRLFICELHPFKQYRGTQARFELGGETTLILAYVHHVSEYLQAAAQNGLNLVTLDEWWHEDDAGKPPRLISFLFQK